MAFGGFEPSGQHQRPMAEINVVPLIDVMLVLLVIFIITAPLFSNAIPLNLPQTQAATAAPTPAQTIHIAIDAQGQLYWNNEALNAEQLKARLTQAQSAAVLPEVQVRADKATPYEPIAKFMAAAQQAGLIKLAFVTEAPSAQK